MALDAVCNHLVENVFCEIKEVEVGPVNVEVYQVCINLCDYVYRQSRMDAVLFICVSYK